VNLFGVVFGKMKVLDEVILRGVFKIFNPLCGRIPIETDLD